MTIEIVHKPNSTPESWITNIYEDAQKTMLLYSFITYTAPDQTNLDDNSKIDVTTIPAFQLGILKCLLNEI